MIRFITNMAAMELGWFACVSGAAKGMPWIGPLVVLALIALHLKWCRRPGQEARLLITAILIGLVADSLLVITGLVSYPSGNWIDGLAPYWILALWAMFATTLNVSMKWLRQRNVLAVILGAVFGPLAYLSGEKLGGITLNETALALSALAVIWGISMPLLMALGIRMDGVSELQKTDCVQSGWKGTQHA